MFTEGLDGDAIKWVQEENSVNTRDLPFSILNSRLQSDPVVNLRNGCRGFGLPPPAMFRSGHLPLSGDDSGSGSDMDTSSDSENEVFGGHYSVVSSSQSDRIPNAVSPKYPAPIQRKESFVSDHTFSDFSSSRETIGQNQGLVGEILGRRDSEYSVQWPGYMKDESSDSTFNSEVSSTQLKSNSCWLPHRGAYNLEGYSEAEQDFHSRGQQNTQVCDDNIPSAPPIGCPGVAMNQVSEERFRDTEHGTPGITERMGSTAKYEAKTTQRNSSGTFLEDHTGNRVPDPSMRIFAGAEAAISSNSVSAHLPTFHASGQDPWCAVISYDACVRLCLHSWASQCTEACIFLENECQLLRNAFGLRQILLQSEEELLKKRSSEVVSEGAVPKPKKTVGRMKVQVRKVKMGIDPHTGCSFSSLKPPIVKLEYLQLRFSNLKSALSSRWEASRHVHASPSTSVNGSFIHQCLESLHSSTQYIKQVPELLKVGVTALRSSSSYEKVQESYSCLLKMRSSSKEDTVPMQPGTGESHVFFPDSLGDDLIIEVQDSKGRKYGHVQAQVAAIAEDPGKNLHWWSIYDKPERELVGRVQLCIDYSISSDENNHPKWGFVAETVAYDFVLEVALKFQNFNQKNLSLQDPWEWLLAKFSHYYGVSDAYTKLRYISHVMNVATATADCLILVHDFLLPVLMKGNSKMTALSHQENRILGEIEVQVQQILVMVFENYKSLDESSPLGIMDTFRPATGLVAPVLAPAVKLYTLMNDILASEAQMKLCRCIQVAAKKRSRRHLAETDEFVSSNNESTPMDSVALTTCYLKMKSLCSSFKNEIFTDIEIHNQNVLPSFVDLPNLSSSIYSVELCTRLRAFLVACPPTGPTAPVANLVIATADFQRDLTSWNINPVKGGVDAKELFHSCIIKWINDKRLALLESCKLDKVKWSGVRTQNFTTPFVDNIYDRLMETLNDYEIIICRWPEYTFVLENAIADVEKEILGALDRQYTDVVLQLKDNLITKKLGLKYVQKFTQRTICYYTVPDELGILLNSMKRMLDVLRPRIETQLKSWGSCIPDAGNEVPGERLGEITITLRAKFRNYLQAVVEKLAENTRMQSATKLKKIIQDSKDTLVESDVRSRMQALKELLTKTIAHLHTVLETNVFLAVCRGLWERMGQDVLSFLETRKENRTWYKGSRVAVSVLDDIFASHMQQLIGNALQQKDVEPPRSVLEVRSILCRDAPNHKDNNYCY